MGLFDSLGSIVADVATGGLAIPFQAAQQGQADANATNIQLSNQAAAFNQASADKQMQFQENMSNTAYQRGTKDMEAAGLNPMLAYSQGGASQPSGASAQQTAAQVSDTVTPGINATAQTASAGLAAMKIPSQLQLQSAQTEQASAQAAASQAVSAATPKMTESNINLNNSMAAVNLQKANEIMADLPEKYQSRDFFQSNPDWFSNNARLDIVKKGLDAGKSAADIIGNVLPSTFKNIYNSASKPFTRP